MIETDYSGSIIWDTHAGGYIVLFSTIDVKLSKALTVATSITSTLGDITVMEGDIDLVHVDHKLKLPIKNDPAAPTLCFGDGDSGFYEIADDEVGLALAGVLKWQTEGCCFMGSNASGPCIINETASATNPTITPDKTDNDTGVGHSGGDQLSLIAGSIEGHRITEVSNNITHILTGIMTTPTGETLSTNGPMSVVTSISKVPWDTHAYTLADGVSGQHKLIVADDTLMGANDVVTVAHLAGGTTLTFTELSSCHLIFTNGLWYYIGGNGVTIA